MVSLARPLLADPDFVAKAKAAAEDINTCIACNQPASTTPSRTSWPAAWSTRAPSRDGAANRPTRSAGVTPSSAPARPGCRLDDAGRARHEVHLYEAAGEIGGQFNMAKKVPGKEEFSETLRYFARRLQVTGSACT